MFSALDFLFWLQHTPRDQVSLDVIPGVGSVVGRELAQSLGARLLVSALRMGEPLVISIKFCFIFMKILGTLTASYFQL